MNQEVIYYFSGASYQDIKIEMNVDQLFSQYHERRLVEKLIDYKKEHPEHTGKIMLDSGSFTAYTKGVELDIDDYLKFLDQVGDYLEVFVAVDDVPDPSNMDYGKAQTTWDNYIYMWERLRPELQDKLMPVFHYGEDFTWLKKYLEHRHPNGKRIPYLGLAISLEGTRPVRIKWARECMKYILASSNPDVKTHAFGVGTKNVLDHISVTSTDATSWVKRAAWGMIAVDDRSIHVSDVLKDRHDKRHFAEAMNAATYERVLEVIKERGFTLEELESDSRSRARFNLMDTVEWLDKINPHSDLMKADLGW